MMSDDFWKYKTELSRVKIQIVLEYFMAWSGIMTSVLKNKPANQRKIGYVDLFAGPGKYGEGDEAEKSTPMLILDYILRKPDIYQTIQLEFNDANSESIAKLKENINSISGIESLRYKPVFTNFEINEQTVDDFYGRPATPTLFFLDPWGYKGLSLELFNVLLKGWGCDCIFFFNYNRIRAAIDNAKVDSIINALFGEKRANHLRMKTNDLKSEESELQIVNELAQALKDIGGTYVLPFRFRDENGNRTSHHLILVSKHFRAYERMKEIMAELSSSKEQGVASFEYNQARERQPFLYSFSRPLDDLKDVILNYFAGRTITVRKIYEEHSVNTPYLENHYKEILKELELEKKITIIAGEGKKRINRGLAGHLIVTFPPKA
jgi:three-Cys-motif partner protein